LLQAQICLAHAISSLADTLLLVKMLLPLDVHIQVIQNWSNLVHAGMFVIADTIIASEATYSTSIE
jgi:hypothetical protein